MEKVEKALGKLKVFRGEMRNTTREGAHNALHASVLSARMYLKQMNQKVQTELIRCAEPVCSLAWILGFAYPKVYLDIAWKYLLQNHAHDSICGCSIDAVHKDMEYRFAQSKVIAEELVQRAFWQIVPEIDNSRLDEKDMAITVFNSLPFRRDEVIAVGIDFPEEWGTRGVKITDAKGKEIPAQIKTVEDLCPEMLNPLNAQLSPHMNRYMIYFEAESVPALGWTTFIAKPLEEGYKRHTGGLVTGHNTMENSYLRVRVEGNGCLEVTDKRTGAIFSELHFFEDGGDAGDAWKYVPPMYDEIVTSKGCPVTISVVDDGPVLARYKIEYHLRLPEEVLPKKPKMIVEEAEPKIAGRSKVWRDYVITSLVTLGVNSRRVDITTRLDNVVKDHRLRVIFSSGVRGAKVSAAEGQFDVVERAIRLTDTSGWKEQAYSTHPQLGFVDVSDGKVGLAILNEGLTEYAVLDDPKRTIALTLLRCVGRSIGEDYDQLGAQCLGEQEFQYSIYPHAGNWEKAEVFTESLRHNTALKATQSKRYSKGSLKQETSFLEILPSAVVLSAVKQSERGNSIILRVYNPTSRSQKCEIRFPMRRFKRARIVNLLEEAEGELDARPSKTLGLDVAAKKIVSIEAFF
jgi:alpha-mannosidase